MSRPRHVPQDWAPYQRLDDAVRAYIRDADAALEALGGVLDVATGEMTSLVAGAGGSDLLWVIEFSPEGDQILLSRAEEMGQGVSWLWSIRADGSELRRLVTGTGSGDGQSLSPAR